MVKDLSKAAAGSGKKGGLTISAAGVEGRKNSKSSKAFFETLQTQTKDRAAEAKKKEN